MVVRFATIDTIERCTDSNNETNVFEKWISKKFLKFALCFITLAVVVGKLMDTKSALEYIEQNIKEVLWG